MRNKPLDKRMIPATYKVGHTSCKWGYNSTYRGCFYVTPRYGRTSLEAFWQPFCQVVGSKVSAIQDGKMEPRINMTMKQYETPVDLVYSQ